MVGEVQFQYGWLSDQAEADEVIIAKLVIRVNRSTAKNFILVEYFFINFPLLFNDDLIIFQTQKNTIGINALIFYQYSIC